MNYNNYPMTIFDRKDSTLVLPHRQIRAEESSRERA